MLNDTKIIVNINFNTNFFLKLPKSIIVFFTSNIGPTTKNPNIEFIGNIFKSPWQQMHLKLSKLKVKKIIKSLSEEKFYYH